MFEDGGVGGGEGAEACIVVYTVYALHSVLCLSCQKEHKFGECCSHFSDPKSFLSARKVRYLSKNSALNRQPSESVGLRNSVNE